MSSVKKTGDLTDERDMTEFQCAKWLLSMPVCVEIKQTIHSLSGK